MKKITFTEMEKAMMAYSKKGIKASAYIVFKESNWDTKYPLESRTYQVFSNAKYFNPNMNGTSLPGYAVDGSDDGVDLRAYNWDVDYCYMDEANPSL